MRGRLQAEVLAHEFQESFDRKVAGSLLTKIRRIESALLKEYQTAAASGDPSLARELGVQLSRINQARRFLTTHHARVTRETIGPV